MLATTAAATFAAFTFLWAVSLRLKDASIVDFYWGPGFAVIAVLAFWMAGRADAAALVFLACLLAWALRLGWYMTSRHGGLEDARYRAMRERHGGAFPAKSLWMVFWLQAAIQWLASSPALAMAAAAGGQPSLWLVWLGAAVFLAGFLIEVAADRAVARFKADAANKGRLLTSGLHGVVRHPNYLGEIILQWGLGVIAFGATFDPLAFAGPALMTALILRLSGVPMLEEQLQARPGFAEWKARTGAILPRISIRSE